MAALEGILGMADRCAGILPGQGFLLLASDEKGHGTLGYRGSFKHMGKYVYFKLNTCNAMRNSVSRFMVSHS